MLESFTRSIGTSFASPRVLFKVYNANQTSQKESVDAIVQALHVKFSTEL